MDVGKSESRLAGSSREKVIGNCSGERGGWQVPFIVGQY